MAQQEKVGIVRAIFRYFRFWNWKKARGIIKAADEQFTGSTDGIGAAFDMHQDKIVSQYRDLRDAISEVESVLEEKRSRLASLNEEENDLLEKRDGALNLAQVARDAGNDDGYEKHASAFERFQVRIDEIEALQERLRKEVDETSETMNRYMLRLQDMQSEIEKLPQQKAEAIADFVSAKRIVELNDRLQGLETSMDRGPISAVLDANKKLTAKARVSEKLAGTDIRVQDSQYQKEGRQSTARNRMEQMMAARNADQKAKTGVKSVVKETDSRPEI